MEAENEIAEVRLANRGGDHRVDQVAHQRRHNLVECRADDDRNRQVHDVSAQDEIAKSFHHFLSPFPVWMQRTTAAAPLFLWAGWAKPKSPAARCRQMQM
jgi:hypothetical protein